MVAFSSATDSIHPVMADVKQEEDTKENPLLDVVVDVEEEGTEEVGNEEVGYCKKR